MKYFYLHIVQLYVRLGLLFTYKKIQANYQNPIPKNAPILFLSNHQNALLDPLLITIKSHRFNYFLTRASVFKNPFIAKFLKALQMLPIYRKRDGLHQLSKNKEIFKFCASILRKKQAIVLFPEGNHALNRSVRTLSKGFTRIIEETLKQNHNINLYIIPVGLNYQEPTQWGDCASVYFGNPIAVKNYVKNQNEIAVSEIKNEVVLRLKQLTTHIEPGPNYNATLEKLKQKQVDFTKPDKVNKYIVTNIYTGKTIRKSPHVVKWLQILIKIIFWGPYLLWKLYIFPRIKEPEFISTYRFAIILTLAPLFLVFQTIVLGFLYSFTTGIIFLLAVLLLVRFTLILK